MLTKMENYLGRINLCRENLSRCPILHPGFVGSCLKRKGKQPFNSLTPHEPHLRSYMEFNYWDFQVPKTLTLISHLTHHNARGSELRSLILFADISHSPSKHQPGFSFPTLVAALTNEMWTNAFKSQGSINSTVSSSPTSILHEQEVNVQSHETLALKPFVTCYTYPFSNPHFLGEGILWIREVGRGIDEIEVEMTTWSQTTTLPVTHPFFFF